MGHLTVHIKHMLYTSFRIFSSFGNFIFLKRFWKKSANWKIAVMMSWITWEKPQKLSPSQVSHLVKQIWCLKGELCAQRLTIRKHMVFLMLQIITRQWLRKNAYFSLHQVDVSRPSISYINVHTETRHCHSERSEESPRRPGSKRFFVVPPSAGLLRMTILKRSFRLDSKLYKRVWKIRIALHKKICIMPGPRLPFPWHGRWNTSRVIYDCEF